MSKKSKLPRADDLLPTEEMTQYAHLSDRTLHRWAELGLIRKYYFGRELRWSKSEIDAQVTSKRPDGVARSIKAMRAAIPDSDSGA